MLLLERSNQVVLLQEFKAPCGIFRIPHPLERGLGKRVSNARTVILKLTPCY